MPKNLDGEEEIHHTSAFYMRNHRIPTVLRPLIPEVSDKLAQKAQIEHLEKRVEMDRTRISKLTRENKRLRKAAGPPSHMK